MFISIRWHEGFLTDCPNGLLDQKQFSKIFGTYYPKGQIYLIDY